MEDVEILADGFKKGFKTEYNGPRVASECPNLKPAFEHSTQLREKVNRELPLGRLAVPFKKKPIL